MGSGSVIGEERAESIDDEFVNSAFVNPFQGKSHAAMDQLIAQFMAITQIDSTYAEHIRKGAFLAQDHEAFARPRDDGLQLKTDEWEALRRERDSKWKQPWILFALVGCCSLGASVQGWDEVGYLIRASEKNTDISAN